MFMEQATGTQNIDTVIRVRRVTRHFHTKKALDQASLEVPRGVVFGLVGENGAGKTTLIKHILGLYKAQQGRVEVFGHDPVADPVAVLSQVGYLSEERILPQWMNIEELLRYSRAFYPAWDEAFARELCRTFELDLRQKVKSLSKGQHVRVSLVIALAHRPELLVLDEPSSGLDPVVRRDILEAIIRTVASEGRTVLFSSHLLDEVERVADYVAMIDRGQVILSDPLDEIQESHHRLTLYFETPRAKAPELPGTLTRDGEGRKWTFVCQGRVDRLWESAEALGARHIDRSHPTLDEIFFAQRGRKPC